MGNRIGMSEYLEAGMRAASLRGKAIANNLANLNTPGYRRVSVAFEEALAKALNSSGPINLDELAPKIFQPMSTPVDAKGNDVIMDIEVGEMVKNSAMYKTYVRMLSKLYQRMELAMRLG